MCSGVESLICDEKISVSPPSSRSCLSFAEPDVSNGVRTSSVFFQEDDESFAILLDKEQRFQVGNPYLCRLKSDGFLRQSRLKAVRWMIKVGSHFSYRACTLCSAVNFLDRFMEKNLDKPWKSWTMDLLSIGCLAIAAKQDEVYVPLLQDLQIGGLEYRFNASAINRMELAILTTLDWRLNAVTPFEYTESMLRCLDVTSTIQTSFSPRVTELIVQTLQEIEFLEYSPSVLAASCMWCTLEELVPVQADSDKSKLRRLVAIEKQNVQRCYEIMQELVVDPLVQPMRGTANPTSPPSPVTVTEVPEGNGNKYNITSATGTVSKVSGVAVAVAQASIKKRARAGQEGGLSDCINPAKRSKLLLLTTKNNTSSYSYDAS